MVSHDISEAKFASTILRAVISIDFDNLLAHCDFLIKGLVSERQRFEHLLALETEGLSDEGRAFIEGWHANHVRRINDVFPSLQATSAFLLAYGMFEKTMNEIAREAGSAVGAKLKLADLHGQGVERAKNFLSKVCGVTSPFTSPEWEVITKIGRLRNVMAHASGELDISKNEHKPVFEYCRKQEKINLKRRSLEKEFAEIELTLDYVIFVTKYFKKFLIRVCNSAAGVAAE